MEENTMLMQALVLSHACFGHNAFFANNYLYKQWTDPEGIIDYLVYAKRYIRECEEKHGLEEVESVLDAGHALLWQSVDKYKRPVSLSAKEEKELQKERNAYIQSQLNDVWRTVPKTEKKGKETEKKFPSEPQENLLHFIEQHAPRLEDWKREILRILRKLAQYFYPSNQLQLMNEGFASFMHYKIIHDLYDKKIIDDAGMMEFYQSHTGVINQLGFDSKYYNGINPYALGIAIYQDIERVSMTPTDEDREWFYRQDWVGSGDWLGTIKWAVENFKDESFIQQFLSPKVIRDFKMFTIHDDVDDPKLEISGIHNKQGYEIIRDIISQHYNMGYNVPDIQVYDVDRWGDRTMTLRHFMVNDRPLDLNDTIETLKHVAYLWGYDVKLESVSGPTDCVTSVYELTKGETILDVFLDEEFDI
jgi:spore cortex formation protein SpoVR/YcgB (stage V sporulation)